MATVLEWTHGFEWREVEIEPKNQKSPRYYEWRKREIARMIVNEGMTVRQIGSIFGIHNCNVYRSVAGLIGGIYSEVQKVWDENKSLSLERANAVLNERRRIKSA